MSDSEMDETTLRLERLIASPPEILFGLWTEPAELIRWWAPEGYEASVDALDTRPGGRWRTTLRRSDGSVLASNRHGFSLSAGPGKMKAAHAATRPRSW